jgi:monovalent cation/hydrogen antiporter
VARRLPRRSLTTLRAESLINDGTALVLYAAAVGVAIGTVQPSWWKISGGVLLSYLGGIAVGLIVIVIVVAVRRHLHDSSLQNAISVVTPFACFVPAEMLHVSGVVAVVTCGLAASQTGPRIIDASTRLQAIAFWRLTTFVLNGSLFILVGLQLPTLLGELTSVSPMQALGFGLLIAATVVLTRLVWANTTPYAIRMIDRRPAQHHQSAQVDRIDADAEGATALPRAHNRNSLFCGTRQLCAVTERSAHCHALNRSSGVV